MIVFILILIVSILAFFINPILGVIVFIVLCGLSMLTSVSTAVGKSLRRNNNKTPEERQADIDAPMGFFGWAALVFWVGVAIYFMM